MLPGPSSEQNESNGPITAPMMSEMLATNQPVMVDDTNIINVWRDNLEQAFKDIAEIVQTVRPSGNLSSALLHSHPLSRHPETSPGGMLLVWRLSR
jgi:hypothetical protein